jgi:heme A synthase
MNTAEAKVILGAELGKYRAKPYTDLLSLVENPQSLEIAASRSTLPLVGGCVGLGVVALIRDASRVAAKLERTVMKHVFVFFLLIAGALAFYYVWDVTTAVAFLVVGLFLEGFAYWWVSRSNDEELPR